jgi:uncharacterized membrane protein
MSTNAGNKGVTFFAIHRIETLTDGVFAIAMTLLVLNLGIPMIAQSSVQSELPRKILEQWPKFVSYMMSFVILGVIWNSHHRIFHYIKRSNAALIWINIIFLMFIALIPFSTALGGDYLLTKSQVPFVVYGVNLFPAFILRYALWAYATNKYRLIESDIGPALIKRLKIMPLIAALILLVSIGVSFLNFWAGYAGLILMLVYGFLSLSILGIK